MAFYFYIDWKNLSTAGFCWQLSYYSLKTCLLLDQSDFNVLCLNKHIQGKVSKKVHHQYPWLLPMHAQNTV